MHAWSVVTSALLALIALTAPLRPVAPFAREPGSPSPPSLSLPSLTAPRGGRAPSLEKGAGGGGRGEFVRRARTGRRTRTSSPPRCGVCLLPRERGCLTRARTHTHRHREGRRGKRAREWACNDISTVVGITLVLLQASADRARWAAEGARRQGRAPDPPPRRPVGGLACGEKTRTREAIESNRAPSPPSGRARARLPARTPSNSLGARTPLRAGPQGGPRDHEKARTREAIESSRAGPQGGPPPRPSLMAVTAVTAGPSMTAKPIRFAPNGHHCDP